MKVWVCYEDVYFEKKHNIKIVKVVDNKKAAEKWANLTYCYLECGTKRTYKKLKINSK